MDAGVDLRVVRGGLRHAPQPVDLGQEHGQRAARAQDLEHARRTALHEAAREFLPDALGHQRVGLAGGHHPAHQRHGLGRDLEVVEARGEAGHAQDAHRVLAEGVGDVAQHARAQVALAAVGVDELRRIDP